MKTNTEVVDRLCKFCGAILSEENQYASMLKTFVCKECHNKRTTKWQKDNHELCIKNAKQRYVRSMDKSISDLEKSCIVCGVLLTDDNLRRANKSKCYYVCRECEKTRSAESYKNNAVQRNINSKKWRDANVETCRKNSYEWRENNLEKSREISVRYQRKIGMKPMSENKECGIYLGVYVAEGVLAKVFKDVERMPFGNIGYDFICSKNKKIDVKSSCIGVNGNWSFHIAENKIADYFICLAFDNRDDLTPMHIWMFPGNVINCSKTISTMPSTVTKWAEYELLIEQVVECCDGMKQKI